MKSFILFLFCIIAVYTVIGQDSILQQKNDKKVALVVGVSTYRSSLSLTAPVNDAEDFSLALRKLGFQVHTLKDPQKKELKKAVSDLVLDMKNASTCLFYFSGHGANYGGENYLFPKNAAPLIPGDLQRETYPVNDVLAKMKEANVPTNIIILDACRMNPYIESWGSQSATSKGLCQIFPNVKTFIGYASAPGRLSQEDEGRHSIYTKSLLKYIPSWHLSLDQLFTEVAKDVAKGTSGRQIPFKISTMGEDYYFIIKGTERSPSKRSLPEIIAHWTILPSLRRNRALRPVWA